MILVSAIVFLLSMALGTPLVRIFSDEGTAVYDLAREGFRIFPFGFLLCGINIFASAFCTALSNVISSLRTFVFLIFFLLTLPLFFRETGVWLAVPLSELLTLAVSAVFLVRNWRKL